jgi:C4-type Zn-finger protein
MMMAIEVLHEDRKDRKNIVQMVECPFCGADLRGKQVPNHLLYRCDANE